MNDQPAARTEADDIFFDLLLWASNQPLDLPALQQVLERVMRYLNNKAPRVMREDVEVLADTTTQVVVIQLYGFEMALTDDEVDQLVGLLRAAQTEVRRNGRA